MVKEFWDFDENVNYVIIDSFKVLNKPGKYEAANLLQQSKIFIQLIIERLQFNLFTFHINSRAIDGIKILINTPFKLQEMQVDTKKFPVKWEGLNKPKNIQYYPTLQPVGEDGKLRAQYRVIFLSLRYNNGKLKSFDELIPLIIHEIAHTAANHVRFRPDDHGADFKMYENIIKTSSPQII